LTTSDPTSPPAPPAPPSPPPSPTPTPPVTAARLLVVCNPASATFDGDALEGALAASFGADAAACARFETTKDDDCRSKLEEAIAAAAERGCDLVLAAGGDGTVSLVANVLAGLAPEGRPLLGIVPQGTANVLARELEVPIEPTRAVALAVARAQVVDLDAIRVDGRHYLTQLGAGLDARMIAGTTREAQKSSGRWAYMRALVSEMVGYRAHRFELVIDGRHYRRRAWQVVVANAKTMGTKPFTWGPEIEPTDGVLNVGVYNVRGVLDWIRLVLRFLTGRHRRDVRARYFQVRERLRIATRHPLPVQGDGEVIGDTPVDVEVAPAILRVVVGPEEAEQTEEAKAAAAAASGHAAVAPPPATTGPAAAAAVAAEKVRLTLWKRLRGVDHAVYLWINKLHAWPPATTVARLVSRSLDHGELWVAIAVLVALFHPVHGWVSMLGVVAVTWLTELTVNYPIKSSFRRRRPFSVYEDARVLAARLPRDWSFPSGHAATAFAGALLLTPALPLLAPLFFAYAVIVALARVYLGVHYPVDVLIGAALGMGLAALYAGIGQALARLMM
jgi:diacylglycerol kinase (ATP)